MSLYIPVRGLSWISLIGTTTDGWEGGGGDLGTVDPTCGFRVAKDPSP